MHLFAFTPACPFAVRTRLVVALACAGFVPGVFGQGLPDAGSVREQIRAAPSLPASPNIRLEGQPLLSTEAGGMKFRLESLEIEGNTVISTEALQALVQPEIGREVDLGSLRAIVNRISEFYRSKGYLFARALVPAQDIQRGVVKLLIVEGKYGKVEATLNDVANERLQAYLRPLKSGEVIESSSVERVALLLADLPGYTAVPVVRPGAEVGTGDFVVLLTDGPQLQGSVRVDNFGDDLTGKARVMLNLARYRNFAFGDSLELSALATEGSTNLLNVQYSLPLQPNGLRGQVAVSSSQYELSGLDGFAPGEFRGSSVLQGVSLSYPLLRSQASNLVLGGGLSWAQYRNIRPVTDDEKYNATTLPLSLRFDHRDSFGGGGVTFGALTLTTGSISNKANYQSLDTLGTYSKMGIDVVRIQRLSSLYTAYARINSQFSNSELDSSERLSAGGPNGVRAFPVGEASGERGAVAQLELRYQTAVEGLQPYLFYDAASITKISKTEGNTSRNISGHGLGVRYQKGTVSADLAAAWVGSGGPSQQTVASKSSPKVWLTFNKSF